MADSVQWAQGLASGVRSTAYHGIGKIHAVVDRGTPLRQVKATACGLWVPRHNVWDFGFCNQRGGSDVTADDYCKKCRARTEGWPDGA